LFSARQNLATNSNKHVDTKNEYENKYNDITNESINPFRNLKVKDYSKSGNSNRGYDHLLTLYNELTSMQKECASTYPGVGFLTSEKHFIQNALHCDQYGWDDCYIENQYCSYGAPGT